MIWLALSVAVIGVWAYCMCKAKSNNDYLDEQFKDANERSKQALYGEQEWREQNDD